ncbi:MAG: FecR family protein [Alphaproteobacteria bacterium]|nr:FecR family protein [Alphaproteobacteria bacterium]
MTKNKKNIVDEEIRKAAAEWVARAYSGNASQSDEEALEKWLAADARHQAEYFHMLEVWDELGRDAMDELVTPRGQARRASIVSRWFRPAMAVAAMLMLSVFGLNLISPDNPEARNEAVEAYATRVGETRELRLEDGSVVTLNTGTKLFVDFNDNMRRAILDSGEAFFDVTKDPSRPFVVTAGSQSVTVLGTRFNVQRKGVKLTVAVVEGKVAVHENIAPERLEEDARTLFATSEQATDAVGFQHYLLEAGSVGTFEKSAELVGSVEVADAESHQSWRQGVVRFSDQSLASVVGELGRYTETPITIKDERAAVMNISGVFHHDDLDGALAGLEAMLPISVTRYDDRIEIALASK